MPRRKRPGTRRQELLDAALELFIAEGVALPRVEDITQVAGAAKGTFYRYFPSKAALLDALREKFNEDFIQWLEQCTADAPAGDWNARVDALVSGLFEFSLSNVSTHMVLFHSDNGVGQNGEVDHSVDSPFLNWLTAFIAEGVNADGFAVSDPAMCASVLFSAFHGTLEREGRAADFDQAQVFRAVLEVVKRALGLPGTGSGAGNNR